MGGETVTLWRGFNYRVTAIEPDKYFVFASESGSDSMAIGLSPLNENHTKLVWRIRLGPYNWKSRWVAAHYSRTRQTLSRCGRACWVSRHGRKAMRPNPRSGCTAN